MGRFSLPKPKARLLLPALVLALMAGSAAHVALTPVSGASLGKRSLQIGSHEVNTVTDYHLTFELPNSGTLGSVLIQFCANDPLQTTPCVVPTGFSASSAVLADQTGVTGFTVAAGSPANEILLTRPATNEPAGPASYRFNGIMNPADQGDYYVRVQTFETEDASGPGSDYGGIAYLIQDSFAVSAQVPPYLMFCTGITIPDPNCDTASGSYIDFGELSPRRTGSGTSQLLVATNALNGYSIWAGGTTLTSGNNVITGLANGDVSRPGTAQFGFNLRANNTPRAGNDPSGAGTGMPATPYGQPNFYRFQDGDTIVSTAAPDNVRKYTASYIANIPATQSAGIYVSTITYVCLANF